MSEYLDNNPREEQQDKARRRNRIIAIGIIAATIPFYCVGLIAYWLAPVDPLAPPTNVPPTATVQSTNADGGMATGAVTSLPTAAPATTTPTATLFIPTATPVELGIPATTRAPATQTPVATATPVNTNTPVNTPVPPATSTPVNTEVPAATATLLPFNN